MFCLLSWILDPLTEAQKYKPDTNNVSITKSLEI